MTKSVKTTLGTNKKNIARAASRSLASCTWPHGYENEESGAAITTSRLAVWINGSVLLSIGRELRAWIAGGGDAT